MGVKVNYQAGDKIGDFVFIRRIPYIKGKTKSAAIFICHFCSKEFERQIDAIKSGRVKSCGCKTSELLSAAGTRQLEEGSIIGRLTFIKRTKIVNKRSFGLFECSCGSHFESRIDAVESLRTKSCGCLTKQFLSEAARIHAPMEYIEGSKIRKLPKMRQSDIDRFWEKVAITANPNACWDWIASGNGRYGMFNIGTGAQYKANRIAYFLHYKHDPGELIVMHSCDRGICCNPAHLSLGTQVDNMRDMKEKGRCGKRKVANNKII